MATPDEGTRGWRLSGRVQGVGFRWFVARAARRRGIDGTVRNLPDGRVEVVARGEAENLAGLEGEMRQGPPGSAVHDVETFEPSGADRAQGFDGFEILG